jgi:hypothetical protein
MEEQPQHSAHEGGGGGVCENFIEYVKKHELEQKLRWARYVYTPLYMIDFRQNAPNRRVMPSGEACTTYFSPYQLFYLTIT